MVDAELPLLRCIRNQRLQNLGKEAEQELPHQDSQHHLQRKRDAQEQIRPRNQATIVPSENPSNQQRSQCREEMSRAPGQSELLE